MKWVTTSWTHTGYHLLVGWYGRDGPVLRQLHRGTGHLGAGGHLPAARRRALDLTVHLLRYHHGL